MPVSDLSPGARCEARRAGGVDVRLVMASHHDPASFFDSMIVASGRRTVVYSPDLLENVQAEMADLAERLGADGPLVFAAGSSPQEVQDHGTDRMEGLTVRLHEDGVQVSARAETSIEDWGWPPDERLFLVFAGAAGGGVFASRSTRRALGGAVQTSSHWSYDPSFAQAASIWVAELMGRSAPDLAERWLARLSELALDPDPVGGSHHRNRAGGRRRP